MNIWHISGCWGSNLKSVLMRKEVAQIALEFLWDSRRMACSFIRMTDQSAGECKTMRQRHITVCTKPQWVPSNAFDKHSHWVCGSLLCKALLWGRQMKQNPFCPWNSLGFGLIDKLFVHDLRVETGTQEPESLISMFFFSPTPMLLRKNKQVLMGMLALDWASWLTLVIAQSSVWCWPYFCLWQLTDAAGVILLQICAYTKWITDVWLLRRDPSPSTAVFKVKTAPDYVGIHAST